MSDIHPNVKDPLRFALATLEQVESKLAQYIAEETDRIFRLVTDSVGIEFIDDQQIGVSLKVLNTAHQQKDKPEKWQNYPREYSFSHIYSVPNAFLYLTKVAPVTHQQVEELIEDGRKHEGHFWLQTVNVDGESMSLFELDVSPEEFDRIKAEKGISGDNEKLTNEEVREILLDERLKNKRLNETQFAQFCRLKEPAARNGAQGVMLSAIKANREILKLIARDAVAAADNNKSAHPKRR